MIGETIPLSPECPDVMEWVTRFDEAELLNENVHELDNGYFEFKRRHRLMCPLCMSYGVEYINKGKGRLS